MAEVIHGDCLEVMRGMASNSVDSLVTDPPAGISFMGKDWDHHKGGRDEWVKWMAEVMSEALRVLKPGAHGLVWALPRTSHWTAMALEDAGFEVRDRVTHLFGTGFPKSLDVGKAIDKAAGAEREVTREGVGKKEPGVFDLRASTDRERREAPATDAARQWDGWGTALKPGGEDWWLVRKPLAEKSVAANVLAFGTGGINIGGTRIGTDGGGTHCTNRDAEGRCLGHASANGSLGGGVMQHGQDTDGGRWPANVILDESAVAEVDAQSGVSGRGDGVSRTVVAVASGRGVMDNGTNKSRAGNVNVTQDYGDKGGASRFFYTPKAPARERPVGPDGTRHPTVKSLALMRYLVRMVTPPGGTVLDPFAGSGATAQAAVLEGMDYIAIEAEAAYIPLIHSRLEVSA